MLDKKTIINTDWTEAKQHSLVGRYYLELVRITTFLFVGIMALMTFLLTVGLQHPQKPFAPVFYTTVVLLAVSLIMFVVGQAAGQRVMRLTTDGASEAKIKSAASMLRIIRLVQQLLFVVSVIAVLTFVIVAAHIFFAPAVPAAGAATGGQ